MSEPIKVLATEIQNFVSRGDFSEFAVRAFIAELDAKGLPTARVFEPLRRKGVSQSILDTVRESVGGGRNIELPASPRFQPPAVPEHNQLKHLLETAMGK